jgi:hypothetical protein
MSKTQDKRSQRKIEHAEFLWSQAQMKAALMQQILDTAIYEVEEHREDLEKQDTWPVIQESMEARKKDIEDFLMREKDKYLERIGIQQD